jgi:hypothetical protein
VRLRGLVRGGRESVASQFWTMTRLGDVVDTEAAARDFLIALADGAEVLVRAGEAGRRRSLSIVAAGRFGAIPIVRGAGYLHEARLGPGEEVEAIGELRRDVDPSVASAHPRARPMRWTLVVPPDGPLALFRSSRGP